MELQVVTAIYNLVISVAVFSGLICTSEYIRHHS